VKTDILNSIKIFIESISGLNTIKYMDSFFDLTKVFTVHSKIDLPLGTEKSFIIVDNDDGTDLKDLDTSDYMTNRYLSFVSPSGTQNDKSILITNFNNATGEITLDEAFGEAITTSNTFALVILDGIFINNGGSFQSYTKISHTVENLPIYLHIQTKQDSDKSKTFRMEYLIKMALIKNIRRIPIYDTNGDVYGNMQIIGSVDDTIKIDNDKQIITSLLSFTVRYTLNYNL